MIEYFIIAVVALSAGIAVGFFLCALLSANGADATEDTMRLNHIEATKASVVHMNFRGREWWVLGQSMSGSLREAIDGSMKAAVDLSQTQQSELFPHG